MMMLQSRRTSVASQSCRHTITTAVHESLYGLRGRCYNVVYRVRPSGRQSVGRRWRPRCHPVRRPNRRSGARVSAFYHSPQFGRSPPAGVGRTRCSPYLQIASRKTMNIPDIYSLKEPCSPFYFLTNSVKN